MINATYYDRGYLSVQVATPRVMLTPDRNGIEITLTINEGPQYKIRQLRVYERDSTGREVEPIGGRRHLREMVRAKSGDVFNRAELAKDLQSVRTMYRDEGYANVEADPETQLDPDKQMVDIVVGIRRGPPVYFERIEVRGNTKTRDKVIRREMQITEGDLFSETKLETSKRLITALGYFERVDISTEEGSASDRINVNVEVGERATGTFQIGAGFSSIENFILTAQIQQANLFGNGQSLSLQAQISSLRQLVNLRLYEPYFLDSKFSAAIDLFDQLRVYPDFAQRTQGGALTTGYPLTQPPYLQTSITYTAELDRVSTNTTTTIFGTANAVSTFQRLPLKNLFTDGFTSSIRPAVTYDTRDNRLFPTSGIYLQGSGEFASPVLGSENQFLRWRATARFYYPLGEGVVLKLNTETGIEGRGRADLRALLPGRHPRRARLPLAHHRSAPAPEPVARSQLAAHRERRAHRRQLELLPEPRAGVPHPRKGGNSRGGIHRPGQCLELGEGLLQCRAGGEVRRDGPLFSRRFEPGQGAHLVGIRDPVVLPARTAALRVGFPVRTAAVRREQRVRVHDRELLLRAARQRLRSLLLTLLWLVLMPLLLLPLPAAPLCFLPAPTLDRGLPRARR
jgi:hypothetical protein